MAESSAREAFPGPSTTAGTQMRYDGIVDTFCKWVVATYGPGTETENEAFAAIVRERVRLAGEPMLTFDPQLLLELNLDPFFEYVKYRHVQSVRPVRGSTLSTFKSAIVKVFADESIPLTPHVKERLKQVFKGLNENEAEGKPITIAILQLLLETCLASGDRHIRSAAAFMAFQWNTCSRSLYTSRIHFAHMDWENDSLAVFFSRNNTDQAGRSTKNKSHIFANPVVPSLCPMLHLALYLVEFGCNGTGFLFPPPSAGQRFGAALSNILSMPAVAEILKAEGLEPGDVYSYSLRKGAALYRSCETSHLQAGDCVIGRTLAGLPLNDPDFGLLPPHFSPRDEVVASVVAQVFPGALVRQTHMVPILRVCLAQLVHHRDFILRAVHKDHPVFSTVLVDDQRAAGLASRLVCGRSSPYMTATGVPVLITMLASLDELKSATDINARLDALSKQVAEQRLQFKAWEEAEARRTEQLVAQVIRRVTGQMANASDGSQGGSPSQEAMDISADHRPAVITAAPDASDGAAPARASPLPIATSSQSVDDSRRAVASRAVQSPSRSPTPSPTQQARSPYRASQEVGQSPQQPSLVDPHGFRHWYHGLQQGCARVPPGWDLPSALLQHAWRFWLMGSPREEICPFRLLTAKDFHGSSTSQKKLTEWRSSSPWSAF